MGDAVRRIRLFVEAQQQHGRFQAARAAWRQKLLELLPSVKGVVDVMRSSLQAEQFSGDVLSVLSDPARERFPLVIAFGTRSEKETAASAVFRCEADGRVYGYRYPFHSVMKSLDPESFADLGEPETLAADAVGQAVAEFLEWAAVGGGCGGRRLTFLAPTTLPFVRPQVKLAVIAA